MLVIIALLVSQLLVLMANFHLMLLMMDQQLVMVQ
jgi:hypothetical protein